VANDRLGEQRIRTITTPSPREGRLLQKLAAISRRGRSSSGRERIGTLSKPLRKKKKGRLPRGRLVPVTGGRMIRREEKAGVGEKRARSVTKERGKEPVEPRRKRQDLITDS